MKKIMFYINILSYGGAERVMSVLANRFSQDSDYEIVFVTSYPSEKEYVLDEKIKRYNLETENRQSGFIKRNVLRIYLLRRLLKQEKPDVLISFMAEPNFRAILASALLKTKVVISVRNDPQKEYPGKLRYCLSQFLFNFADGCVFQTEDAKKCYGKKIQKKSSIILNPVSEKFYQPLEGGRCRNVISVGRYTEQKNFKLLIEAFSDIADRCPEDNLLIYGQGELEEELRTLIKDLNMEERIYLMGTTNNVEEVLKDAKLFVLSSDYEGMPNALMEAIAVGIPVISTDCPCGGPRMLIKNNENGILVKVGDKNGLAKAIGNTLDNESIRKKYVEMNKMVRQNFRETNIVAEWKDYINKCL